MFLTYLDTRNTITDYDQFTHKFVDFCRKLNIWNIILYIAILLTYL